MSRLRTVEVRSGHFRELARPVGPPKRDGTRGKKVAGGTSGPGGSCKNRSRRDGSLTFNIRGECQTGPTARAGWRSDAGAWCKVSERPARSGHGTGHVVSPGKLEEFGPHPNPLPPKRAGEEERQGRDRVRSRRKEAGRWSGHVGLESQDHWLAILTLDFGPRDGTHCFTEKIPANSAMAPTCQQIVGDSRGTGHETK